MMMMIIILILIIISGYSHVVKGSMNNMTNSDKTNMRDFRVLTLYPPSLVHKSSLKYLI